MDGKPLFCKLFLVLSVPCSVQSILAIYTQIYYTYSTIDKP